MPILAFVVAPALATYTGLHAGIATWLALITGMVWQFVLSVVLLSRELNEFSWTALRRRIWLQAPQSPKTGKPDYRLF